MLQKEYVKKLFWTFNNEWQVNLRDSSSNNSNNNNLKYLSGTFGLKTFASYGICFLISWK